MSNDPILTSARRARAGDTASCAVPPALCSITRRNGERSAEGVLHLLAGLLEVGLGLVELALTLEVLVVLGLAHCFLGLAELLVGDVLELLVGTHGVLHRCSG